LFGPITDLWHSYVDLVEWCLRELTDVTGNAGLAIILFTIALKTVLLPLTVKSIKSTAAMQELQPRIKELQKKYAKDVQKRNQEMMRLYQEYQINPAAGCLPLLIQIPIFFGLYFAVRDLSNASVGSFLWLDDLSEPDPLKILPLAAGAFQFMQTMMMRPRNAPKISDPQQQMMQTMMTFMPIMVVIFGWSFASGAVLYWATQSVYSVIQQWFITGWGKFGVWLPWLPELPEHRRLGRAKPLERRDMGEDFQPTGLMGRLQKRAQEMEQRQAARQGRTVDTATTGAKSAAKSSRPAPGGKRAKQSRAPSGVREIDDGADESEPVTTDTRATTRVMSSRGRDGSRRARNNGRAN
jgi:YidC/Oxa1 family membrane protein insertase